MDESGGYGMGDDPGHKLNMNEAILAVADDGFVVEEEDDDYEDLYSDVNVGEGFLKSLKSNDESLVETVEEAERNTDLPQQFSVAQHTLVSEPASAGNVAVPVIAESGVEGFKNQGMREAEMSGTTGGGLRVELAQGDRNVNGLEQQNVGQVGGFVQQAIPQPPQGPFQHEQSYGGGDMRNLGNVGFGRGENMNFSGLGANGINNIGGSIGGHVGVGGVSGNTVGGGGTMLFVGELHWWTTDAELEAELCKYGDLKEVKFFDEKASGKSRGYCQVEFCDPGAAAACKEGMDGQEFNGTPCVVAFATPFSIKRMGEAQLNRTPQSGQAVLNQPKRGPYENAGKTIGNNIATGGNYHGGGDNSRGGNRNWARGNSQGIGNRGGHGGMRRGGRGIMGNGGNTFNQGMGGNSQVMHPQGMMGHGFDPAFGGPLGGMGSYGGFPGGHMAPFMGMMQPFPPGMPGVALHVNPAFFGRGMPMNGMVGPNMGMWQDPNMAGWGAEDYLGKERESSYGDEVASDPRHEEANQDRDGRQGVTNEKDRGPERDRSVSSDKKYREEKETGVDKDLPKDRDTVSDRNYFDSSKQCDERDINRSRERELSHYRDLDRVRERDRDRERDRERERGRDHYRDDRAKYADHHKLRDHESERDFDWEGGSSSRTHSKSRYDDDRRPRSRDADYGKKRRLTAE